MKHAKYWVRSSDINSYSRSIVQTCKVMCKNLTPILLWRDHSMKHTKYCARSPNTNSYAAIIVWNMQSYARSSYLTITQETYYRTCIVLRKKLTLLLLHRKHITGHVEYCVRNSHAYSYAESTLKTCSLLRKNLTHLHLHMEHIT